MDQGFLSAATRSAAFPTMKCAETNGRGARRVLFATGIECSAPTIDNGRIRRDLLQECGHYDHWQEDFALVKDLGLSYLRYGLALPYHT